MGQLNCSSVDRRSKTPDTEKQHIHPCVLSLIQPSANPNLAASPSKVVVTVPSYTPVGPLPSGARVWIWKQDPTVTHIGIRKVFLPSKVYAGPQDERIATVGRQTIVPDASGDILLGFDLSRDMKSLTDDENEAMDMVHCFAVVRQALTMYQRALRRRGQRAELPWRWNDQENKVPIKVHAHGLPGVANAVYIPGEQALKFGDFIRDGESSRIYNCRSLDVVAHEAGHAILDGLKPGWMSPTEPPQTGALHEAFGDLTAMFLVLSQLDLVEALIAETKADLYQHNFMSILMEQFGAGLAARSQNGLRNAFNTIHLKEAGPGVHALSEVFTGAMYYILADMFSLRRRPHIVDDAQVLHETADDLLGLLLHAIQMAPEERATFADIGYGMRDLAAQEGSFSAELTKIIGRRFEERGVLFGEVYSATARYAPQDRSHCCGTMRVACN